MVVLLQVIILIHFPGPCIIGMEIVMRSLHNLSQLNLEKNLWENCEDFWTHEWNHVWKVGIIISFIGCLFENLNRSVFSLLSALMDIFLHLSLVSRSTRMFIHQHLHWRHLFGWKVIYLAVISSDLAVSLTAPYHFENFCIFCYFFLFFAQFQWGFQRSPAWFSRIGRTPDSRQFLAGRLKQ